MTSNRFQLNGSSMSPMDQIRTQLQSMQSIAVVADRRVEQFEDLIEEIELSGLLHHTVLLGDALLKRPYAPVPDGHDAGELVQPALLIPQGLGALHWNSERYFELSSQPQGLEAEASNYFVPIAQCKPAVRALVALELDDFLIRLCDLVSNCGI